MAKKKRGGRRKAKALPLAVLMPLSVPIIRAAQQSGSYGAKADRFVRSITGVSVDAGKFNYEDALPFWLAEGAGIVVHKVANRVGVNNYIRRATMGWFSL